MADNYSAWMALSPEQKREVIAAQQQPGGGSVDPQQAINDMNMLAEPVVADDRAALQEAKQYESQRATIDTPSLDLSPLAALAENYTGRKLNYKRPGLTDAEREQLAEKINDRLSEKQSGISKTEQAILRDVLQGQLYGKKADASASKTKTAEETAAERDLSTRREKLGKEVSEFSTISESLGIVSSMLGKYPPGTDIPGYGSQGIIPSELPEKLGGVNDEARSLRDALAGLSADVIKLYSGTAASEKEVARQAKAIGSNWSQTDKELRDGVKFLQDKIRAKQSAVESGYGKDVRESYKANGGKLSSDMFGYDFGSAQAKKDGNRSDAGKPPPPAVGTIEEMGGKRYIHRGNNKWDPTEN